MCPRVTGSVRAVRAAREVGVNTAAGTDGVADDEVGADWVGVTIDSLCPKSYITGANRPRHIQSFGIIGSDGACMV